jgi:fructan beta-fructosidase
MHWGHAVSRDLLHWQHLPVALAPDRLGMAFTGSAVLDANNTSGLGTRTRPPLVAIYTAHDEVAKMAGHTGFERQALAWSLDHGRSWRRYAGNPVLSAPGVRDFRDPAVSWHAATRRWVMVVSGGDHLEIHSSPDLIHWRHESDFGAPWGPRAGVWECPGLRPMRIAGESLDRWLLTVSVAEGGPNGGSATQYFSGDFDGRRFVPDAASPPDAARWVDWGTDDYAGVTWNGLPATDGRTLFLGWMSNWQYATRVPTQSWRSAMTVPRELRLVHGKAGPTLRALPVAELRALRGRDHATAAQVVRGALELAGPKQALRGPFELELALDLKEAGVAELAFGNGRGERTVLRFDAGQGRIELDRRASGEVAFHPAFAAVEVAPMPATSQPLRLTVIVDASSIEVFANEGETVMTALVFPTAPYDRVTLGAADAVGLGSTHLYELESSR